MLSSKNEISKVAIFGDNKPFLIALIVVNNELVKKRVKQAAPTLKINVKSGDTLEKILKVKKSLSSCHYSKILTRNLRRL